MMKKSNNILSDNFEISGKRSLAFQETLSYFLTHTHILNVDLSEIIFCSLVSNYHDCSDNRFYLDAIRMDPIFADITLLLPAKPEYQYFQGENRIKLPLEDLYKKGLTSEEIEEIYELGYFLEVPIRIGSNKRMLVMPTKTFLADLCKILGIGRVDNGISPLRDLYLASIMGSQIGKNYKMVYRINDNGIAKIVGIFSNQYEPTPRNLIASLLMEIQTIETDTKIFPRCWIINHKTIDIQFQFKDYILIKDTPIRFGFRLVFSDSGDSSYALQFALYVNGGMVIIGKQLRKKHAKNFYSSTFVSEFLKLNQDTRKNTQKILLQMANTPIDSVSKNSWDFLKKTKIEELLGKKEFSFLKEHVLMDWKDERGTNFDAILNVFSIVGSIAPTIKNYKMATISKSIGDLLKEKK